MSDVKPRRTAREPMRPEPAKTAAVPPLPEPVPTTEAATAVLAAAAAEPQREPPPPAALHLESSPLPAAGDDDPWAAFAEVQSALARGFEAIATEIAGMTHSGIANTTNAALALIGARTLAEAVEINAGLAKRGVDAAIESSAKLSEIGLRTASEASQPLLSRLAAGWKLAAAGSAGPLF